MSTTFRNERLAIKTVNQAMCGGRIIASHYLVCIHEISTNYGKDHGLFMFLIVIVPCTSLPLRGLRQWTQICLIHVPWLNGGP